MSDIYKIPNDDGETYRLKKFVEYQHEVPSIHYRFLGEYIKDHMLSQNETIDMCFYMSATYNELTCILIHNLLKTKSERELVEMKEKLNFASSRKYMGYLTRFEDALEDWLIESRPVPEKWLKKRLIWESEANYVEISKALQKVRHTGRFGADLFLETLIYLKGYLGINVTEPKKIDWENCSNLTAGIFNIFYEDERANAFGRKGRLSREDINYLTEKLGIIQEEIRKTYPEQDSEISMFIGKICSFRNLFKNARYGGYHHDRQLGCLKKYQELFPDYTQVWEECYELRKRLFDERFLGEIHGWSGIRKEMKKIWLTTGLTGAEKDFAQRKLV